MVRFTFRASGRNSSRRRPCKQDGGWGWRASAYIRFYAITLNDNYLLASFPELQDNVSGVRALGE